MEYYRSREGKLKKHLHNQRRGSRPSSSRSEQAGSGKSGDSFDSGIVRYVQMVTSLIEGRRVSETEIVRMLVRAVRQHSMARRRRRDYILSCWKQSLESP
ncbi:MAG: hypothetical protein FWD64_09985 [Acidobacteriaceae bacterium]|nr:hypothetical protein [Acidobacteriaceae bacterium]